MDTPTHAKLRGVTAAALIALLVPACWPHVEIDGAPCPCPDGFACCGTLSTCLSEDELEVCPSSFPPSSGSACNHDQDCGPHEACRAWTVAGGEIGGAQDCRTICDGPYACAPSETCQFMPRDSLPLDELHLVRACVPEAASPGCERSGCADCPADRVGRTFCDDNLLRGCLLAINPQCGVDCRSVVIQDCETINGCVSGPTDARCVTNSIGVDPCDALACSSCVGPLIPGGVACNGDRIASCLSVPFAGTTCDQVCLVHSETCPDASTCGLGELGPVCMPQ